MSWIRPCFEAEAAAGIARDLFGFEGELRELPSERDQNFRVTKNGESWVLKLSQAEEDRDVLDFQNEVLLFLERHCPDVKVPKIRSSVNGHGIDTVEGREGRRHFVRMLSYLPGRPLYSVPRHSPSLLRSLGTMMGRVDRALVDFEHRAMGRELQWDFQHAHREIEGAMGCIQSPEDRELVARVAEESQRRLEKCASELRRSVIHNDANDYNVLVAGTPWEARVSGLIDFGDMVHSYIVGEVAIASTYAMLDREDPLAAASEVLGGYQEAFALSEMEVSLVAPLIQMRLCLSVSLAAKQRQEAPDNEYLGVTERPGWALLKKLSTIPPALSEGTLRTACGFEPFPHRARVDSWLRDHAKDAVPVLGTTRELASAEVFDLSVGSPRLGPGVGFDVDELSREIEARMAEVGAAIGVGRYDEARLLYQGDSFKAESEPRTIHLGLDLFAPAGTEVRAPLEGTIHSFADNTLPLDYGPAVLLCHRPEEGVCFFSLYGHLSRDSLEKLEAGRTLRAGEVVGRLGDPTENGGWPPHLHFQLMLEDLGYEGDFPGVAQASKRELWKALCPDPNVIVKVPAHEPQGEERGIQGLLDARERHFGRGLSVSYRKPLKIVRGAMQYLYDQDGRAYLDAVNNVPHVGHCHPHVVRAGWDQMRVLNTNSRYLHDELARYIERLAATFPDPLNVCYLVCTGSEANELALRLARAHTGGREILVLDGAYHGNTDQLVDLSPYKFAGPGGKGAPDHVHVALMPDPYRGPYKGYGADVGARYASHVDEIVKGIGGKGGKIAAFLAESMLGCGGQIVLPEGYLKEAYASVRQVGGVCIADEVQVGFGRAGTHFWAFETQGVVPDIVTLGKPIGNGHPLAAVVTTEEIAASFDTGMEYFNTFGGNPVSCAIGQAVLDVIENEGLQDHAREVGESMLAGLAELKSRHPLIGDVRGLGLYIGVELVLDRESLEPAAEMASAVVERMKEEGILMSTDGPLHNVLKIKPPLVFSSSNAKRLVETLDRVLSEVEWWGS